MKARFVTLLLLAAGGLAACSSNTEPLAGKKLDYQSADPNRKGALEVPPDLTTPELKNTYALPKGTVSANAAQQAALNKQQSEAKGKQGVLVNVPNVKLERDGSQRWLRVTQTPEALWPILEEFWQDNGFVIKTNEPKLGLMETDWAENRAKLPQDGVRFLLSKVGLDGLYSTPERDKFRVRIERGAQGTEVYFTHRGLVEVYSDESKGQTMWQARAADPELEAELLGRFMLRLGLNEEKAREEIKNSQVAPATTRARIEGNSVVVNDPFDRAWRRSGLALDRAGLVVVDRNRQAGVYYVRPAQTELDKKDDGGFWSSLAFWRSKGSDTATNKQPALQVKLSGAAENQTRIQLLDPQGHPLSEQQSSSILRALQQQLN